jgi:demethylmenaquinone methyltransferase/2-methoxy-6-polyprenyl-1,4-benzoquinol methylase
VSSPPDAILTEQIAYYRARANEYDEWFLRQGRYDRGPESNARWFAEVAQIGQALERFHPSGEVLELACGTGLWTQHLARSARSLTAVDSAPEMLALNQRRLGNAANIRYLQADLFTWTPDRRYDAVFFSFWLSHVPPERFAPFWNLVRDALNPGGRVFFVDSRYSESSTASDHVLEGEDATTLARRLNDGREYRIVKVFHAPDALEDRLRQLGWTATVTNTPTYFYYGEASATT